MSVKVAINGFGRIGRLAFRQMFGADGYEVVAINDLTKPSMLAHLLKYDTAQGGYAGKIGENKHTVSADDEAGTITVDGKTLKIYAKANAAELPWGEIGVDVVLECTGFYTSKAKAQAHIDAGAKKVVIVSQKYHLHRSLYILQAMVRRLLRSVRHDIQESRPLPVQWIGSDLYHHKKSVCFLMPVSLRESEWIPPGTHSPD